MFAHFSMPTTVIVGEAKLEHFAKMAVILVPVFLSFD